VCPACVSGENRSIMTCKTAVEAHEMPFALRCKVARVVLVPLLLLLLPPSLIGCVATATAAGAVIRRRRAQSHMLCYLCMAMAPSACMPHDPDVLSTVNMQASIGNAQYISCLQDQQGELPAPTFAS
jgi:hypothetical protein